MRWNFIRRNRRGIVGAAACPDALEFYTQKPAGHCRGGGMPRPYKSNQPRTSEGRLLLEEKLSARKG